MHVLGQAMSRGPLQKEHGDFRRCSSLVGLVTNSVKGEYFSAVAMSALFTKSNAISARVL